MPKKIPSNNPAGRPPMPPHCRRVHLTMRVLPRIKAGLAARAAAHHSSIGREVERAFDQTCTPPG